MITRGCFQPPRFLNNTPFSCRPPLPLIDFKSNAKKLRNSSFGLYTTNASARFLQGHTPEKYFSAVRTSIGVALIFSFERSIAYAGIASGLRIPSAPVGMVLVFLALNIINHISKGAARSMQSFFSPALAFYGVTSDNFSSITYMF